MSTGGWELRARANCPSPSGRRWPEGADEGAFPALTPRASRLPHLPCPTSFAGHGGIENNLRESRSPLLGQGGVAAPIKKMPRSFLSGRRRGGWFKPPIIGS